MTERKRLKKVRRRNEKVKSYNFETKTLEHIPILSSKPTEGEVQTQKDTIARNKILRGIRINELQAN